MTLSFNLSASMPKGAFATVPSMLPDMMAAIRDGSSPICRILTSFPGSMPSRFNKARRPKSAEEPNRLTPSFLPFNCSTLLISGRVTSW